MPDLKQAFREEIARLAKKEIKTAAEPIQVQMNALKKQLAQLKKELAEVQKLQQKNATATVIRAEIPAAVVPAKNADGMPKKQRKPRTIKVQSSIKTIRKRLKLSQSILAKLLNVSPNSVVLWENGKVQPRAEMLAQINQLKHIAKKQLKQLMAEKSLTRPRRGRKPMVAKRMAEQSKAAKSVPAIQASAPVINNNNTDSTLVK